MILFANFLIALTGIVGSFLFLLLWAFVLYAVVRLINADPGNFFVRLVYSFTEPVLMFLVRKLPFLKAFERNRSLLALVAFGLCFLLNTAVVGTTESFGQQLRAKAFASSAGSAIVGFSDEQVI